MRNALIAESPWLIRGKKESQARRNVGLLFDENSLTNQINRTQKRLREMQLPDGSWSWFPGGRANDYLTLYITTGYGRLRKLGVDVDVQPAIRAIGRLDNWLKKRHDKIIRHDRLDKPNIDSMIAMYLYGRTFFLDDKPISDQHRPAFDYFVAQAKVALDQFISASIASARCSRITSFERSKDACRDYGVVDTAFVER